METKNLKQNDCQVCVESLPLELCRLCASSGKKMISIYGDEGTRMALAYKINKQLPIQVSPKNKLPLEVCKDCIAELNACIGFTKKCLENQVKLMKILNITLEDYNVSTEIPEKIVKFSFSKKRRKSTSKYKTLVESKDDNELTSSCNSKEEILKVNHENLPQEDHDEENAFSCFQEKEMRQSDCVSSSNEKDLTLGIDNGHNKSEESEVICLDGESSHSIGTNGGNNNLENDDKEVLETNVESDVKFKHVCKYCDKGFTWKAELFTHQVRSHPDLVSRCTFCLKIFYNKEEFYLHELAHRKQLPPGFKGKISLRRHLKGGYSKKNRSETRCKSVDSFSAQEKIYDSKYSVQHSTHDSTLNGSDKTDGSIDDNNIDENDKTCNYCDITFDSVKEQRKHVKANHKLRLPCRFCPRTFCYDFELKKHEAVHRKGKGNIICDTCGENFDSYYLFEEHKTLTKHFNEFQCEICEEKFSDCDVLEQHVQTHAGQTSYLCEICGKDTDSFITFRKHKMNHIRGECHKCKICSKSFFNFKECKVHEQTHAKKRKLRCKICNESFLTSDLLKEHKLLHENVEHKCEFCVKSFTSLKKLKNHLQTHSLERNYLCEKCGKDFKSNSTLNKHRYLCQVAIACTVCGKEFDCNTRLKVHMRMHTGEKPFVCTVCGKGFHASWSLVQHSATHSSVKIPCPICGALFNRKSNMLTHKKRHRVPCETCGQIFANTPLLLVHQKTHREKGGEGQEEGEKEDSSPVFRCKECGKLFVTSLDLKAHLMTHSDERPYKCEICGKSWRLQKTLKKHMITHSGRKPYQCRYCTCTFLLHQRLVKHENGHTVGKPYSCQECGQSFWTQLNLEKHSVRHCVNNATDQKYMCNFCNKSFDRKSSLMIHKRQHTSQLSFGCSFCPRKFSQLRFAQRHKCALDPNNQIPNNQITNASMQKGLFSSLTTLNEESCSADENACPELNEEIVYDMDPVSTPYAEIIVISQSMDDLIVENSSEIPK